MKKILFIATVLFQTTWASEIEVKDVSIRLLPGTTTAAFLSLENKTDKEIVLEKVSGDFAETFELHDMVMEAGRMQMRPLSQMIIQPKSKLELKHGGKHIMIFNVKKPLSEKESYILNLHFKNLSPIKAKAKAVKPEL